MGRSRAAKRGVKAPIPIPPPVPTPAAPEPEPEEELTPHELLIEAAALIASCDYEAAKDACAKAVEGAIAEGDGTVTRDAYEILGTIELELGELDEAREHFLISVQLAESVPDPSPAPHLYLAQLSSPEESLIHFAAALVIIQDKLAAIERTKLGGDGGAGSSDELEEEGELRRSASRALVGMTELYLTDLCFEPDAEQTCEKHLALASSIDPSDPEVYQTLASVRLSQERPEEAKAAALKGWSLWRKLGPESPDYPVGTTRMALAKLLLELSLHSAALEILQQLENEDDEDAEVWYLSGWAWWLLGEERGPGPRTGDDESREECWSEGKLCLENYLRLDKLDPESSDPEQMEHVRELLNKLDAAGVVASAGHLEGGEDWEDESDGEEDEEDAMEE